MGMFDEIEVGDRHGQVKLWDNMLKTYRLGDIVPPVRLNVPDFDIAMREGGYVHVRALKIQGWDDERDAYVRCYDKWGDPWVSSTENLGEIGRELRDAGITVYEYFWPNLGQVRR